MRCVVEVFHFFATNQNVRYIHVCRTIQARWRRIFFSETFLAYHRELYIPCYCASAVNKLFSKTNSNISLESNFSRGYKLIFLPFDRPPMVNSVNPSELELPACIAVKERFSTVLFCRCLQCVILRWKWFLLFLLSISSVLTLLVAYFAFVLNLFHIFVCNISLV